MAKSKDGLNYKQRLFADLLFKYGNQTKAYEQAYSYDTQGRSKQIIHQSASRLAKHEKVQARIEMLRAKSGISREHILEQLSEDRDFSIEQDNPSSAVSASMGMAKVLGYLNESVEVTHNTTNQTLISDLSTEDLQDILRLAQASD